MDVLGYIGTVLVTSASLAPKRYQTHFIRAIGLSIWVVFAYAIDSTPLFASSSIGNIIEIYALVKCEKK
jgi:hypothetical protein